MDQPLSLTQTQEYAMAYYASVYYVAEAYETTLNVPFSYLDKAHVKLEVNGIARMFSWVSSSTITVGANQIEPGDTVYLYRSTSPGTRLVNYAPVSISAGALNTDSLQALYRTQELSDKIDRLVLDVTGFNLTNYYTKPATDDLLGDKVDKLNPVDSNGDALATEPWVTANFSSGGGITQTEADARYLQLTGGTVSGPLFVTAELRPDTLNVQNPSPSMRITDENVSVGQQGRYISLRNTAGEFKVINADALGGEIELITAGATNVMIKEPRDLATQALLATQPWVLSNSLDQSEADALYLSLSGGTVSGFLIADSFRAKSNAPQLTMEDTDISVGVQGRQWIINNEGAHLTFTSADALGSNITVLDVVSSEVTVSGTLRMAKQADALRMEDTGGSESPRAYFGATQHLGYFNLNDTSGLRFVIQPNRGAGQIVFAAPPDGSEFTVYKKLQVNNNIYLTGLVNAGGTVTGSSLFAQNNGGPALSMVDANLTVGTQGRSWYTTNSAGTWKLINTDGLGNNIVAMNSDGSYLNAFLPKVTTIASGITTVSSLWNTNISQTATTETLVANRGNSNEYSFLETLNSAGSIPNYKHRLRGDGVVQADGSYSGAGADYAEYFETVDGSSIEPGVSVALQGDKVRRATSRDHSEDIIGVIRPDKTPVVIGDGADFGWHERYLRDDFGAPVLDDEDNYVMNPQYDPERPYTPRSERPEWVLVGLLGKVPVRKGEPTGRGWRLMKEVSDAADLWFIK